MLIHPGQKVFPFFLFFVKNFTRPILVQRHEFNFIITHTPFNPKCVLAYTRSERNKVHSHL